MITFLLFFAAPQGFSHLSWMPVAAVVAAIVLLVAILWYGSRRTV